MTRRVVLAVAVVTVALATVSRAQTRRHEAAEWGVATDTVRVAVEGMRFTLRHPFVVEGSEIVRVGDAVLSSSDYVIDYRRGSLRIDVPIPAGAIVVVTYRRQRWMLQPVYTLRPMVTSPRDSAAVALRPVTPVPSPTEARAPTGLVFGGTKTVSFTVGSNRGTTLDQTLHATIEGQLTPTISVRALLSDDNLPIQPEGNTEELEYFDQVFVEITGPRASATLGDFSFVSETSTFSPLVRELRGFTGTVDVGRGRVRAAAATSKGVFRSLEFRGTSGLQGPYELLSAGRNTGEVIIAGTEKVYVDGALQTRGDNRDYVIDYDRGTVTFTPRRLITVDSEIAIDFEVTQERYRRGTWFASTEDVDLGRGVRFHAVVAGERDDRNRPLDAELTDEDRAILEAAGDSAGAAISSGVVTVEAGRGEYERVLADSVTAEHYVFNDTTGTYIVSFVEVGAGAGDYKLGGISARGRPIYQYVGTANGNYIVGRKLAAPESLRLITTRLNRARGKHLFFDLEWNLSDYDRNLFSAVDDDDNTGEATRMTLGIKDLPAGPMRMRVSGNVSTLEERFKSFDRVRPRFYYRDWNLENVALTGRETIAGVEVGLDRKNMLGMRYGYDVLDREQITGTRQEAALTAGKPNDRGLSINGMSVRVEQGADKRKRDNTAGGASFGFWKVRPSLRAAAERYREFRAALPDSGRQYTLVGGAIENRSAGTLRLRAEVEGRETESVSATDESWVPARRDRTVSALAASTGDGAVRGELRLTHREEENLLVGGTTKSDLGVVKAGVHGPDGTRADIDYEISQNSVRTLERSVVFIGEGKGDYNALGEAVGKGRGAYTLVFLPTTEVVPTRRADLSLRLVWQPPRADERRSGAWGWIRDNVSVEQTLTINEETTYEPGWKVYLFFPDALQRNDATRFGSTGIRQDWSLLNAVRNVSLTYRYRREDTEDNRFEGTREARLFGEHALRVAWSLSARYTLRAEASRTLRRRGGVGIIAATGSAYDAIAWRGLTGLGLRVGAGTTLDLDLSGTTQSDGIGGVSQDIVAFAPKLVWQPIRVVNVYGLYELNAAKTTGTGPRPIVFTNDGTSHRWSLAPTVRVSKAISIVATYQGRREKTFSGITVTDNELRLETRAFF